MSYRPIKYGHITDPEVRSIFHRADRYISDVYSMFYLPLKGRRRGGNCDLTMVLTLLCVVDGIAKHIYPRKKKVGNRFTQLLRDKLHWVPSNNDWIERNRAAELLYEEFRNPLVHGLGEDEYKVVRRGNYGESIIGRWGHIPLNKRTIDRIDRMKVWNDAWPTMYIKADSKPVIKLTSAALYWSVKRMVGELAKDFS